MRLGSLGKVWLALLLLCATLSSAPMGSMEQSARAAIGKLGHAHSVPAVRPSGALQLANALVGAARPDLSRAPPAAPLPCSSPGGLHSLRDRAFPASQWTSGHTVRPLCERLPYHANAPPAST